MPEIQAPALLSPDREIRPATIEVDDDGRITGLRTQDGATDGILTPGLVDLQCNGAAGAGLAEATADAFDRVGAALLAGGTTSYCPTLPSAPVELYPRFLDAAADARTRPGPRILGVHLEGPFLNPTRAGAHPPECLRPADTSWLEALLDRHHDLVRIVTLAPEIPGALEVISLCVERGITVAVGHSDATADEAAKAFDAGAVLLTHLFNAMRPIHHRDPGIGGEALTDTRVRCSLIADGRHVAPSLASFYARSLGPYRCVLVSDAVATPTDSSLSGGFVLLDKAVANMTSWGLAFADAVRMATVTPADIVGAKELGRLEVGSPADAVLWKDAKVAAVWMNGTPV